MSDRLRCKDEEACHLPRKLSDRLLSVSPFCCFVSHDLQNLDFQTVCCCELTEIVVLRVAALLPCGAADVLRATETAESRHEWFYFSEMQCTEAIIFINYDSDESAPQFIFHGALDLNHGNDYRKWRGEAAQERRDAALRGDASKASPVRLSLEVRVLVLIDSATDCVADGYADMNANARVSES